MKINDCIETFFFLKHKRHDKRFSRVTWPIQNEICQLWLLVLFDLLFTRILSGILCAFCLQVLGCDCFRLDPVMQKACQGDVQKVCGADSLEDQDSHPVSLILSCLYRHIVLDTDVKVQPWFLETYTPRMATHNMACVIVVIIT